MKNILLCLIFVCVLGLVGCGRVSKPIPPSDSFYPHAYIVTEN